MSARRSACPRTSTKQLSSSVWGWGEDIGAKHAAELNLNLGDRRLRLALELAQQLIGAPRHLSQHPGGFVLTDDRLDELVPIEPAAMADRQVIEWDKDDIDILKFMKVDCLALGMLSCMKRGFDLLRDHKGIDLDLATIPAEDPRTYAMIRKADTLGTFQIESRAQMAMLPRIKPRTFYDLVIEVAIVRPGPIQGDMVHPYLRRREGKEAVDYPKPELEKVLGKTLGVPLFQEQAMRVAIECAGFTPSEADQLRRAMATFKFTGGVSPFRDKLIGGMVARGYEPAFAERTFAQLEGFGSYGFPESHAASFALIAYASSWLKCWHPDVFCAALLNAQPMGFYAPGADRARRPRARRRGPPDLRQRQPLGLHAGADGHTRSLRRPARAAHGPRARQRPCRRDRRSPRRPALRQRRRSLAARRRPGLGAGPSRRGRCVPAGARPGAPRGAVGDQGAARRTAAAVRRRVGARGRNAGGGRRARRRAQADDRRRRGGRGLPPFRPLAARTSRSPSCAPTCAPGASSPAPRPCESRDGRWLETAGIVLVRQMPGSAKGVLFVTLEDETGVANLVIWPKLYERQRRVILAARMLAVWGRVQREGAVVHLVANRLTDLSADLASIGEREAAFPLPHGRGDEFHHGSPGRDPRDLPKPRDIHDPHKHIDQLRIRPRDFR